MRRLHVSRDIAAPPEVVWGLLVDLDRWPQWGPTVRGAGLDGGGRRLTAGSTGWVRTPLGVRLPFRVDTFEAGRAWSWRVAGVPATDHTVAPVDAGARLSFGVPAAAAPYLGVCAAALKRIDHLATAGERPDT